MRKHEIEFHRVGYGGKRLPAINVKAYHFADKYRHECDGAGYTEDEVEEAFRFAFELHQELFWETAQDNAVNVWGDRVKIHSEGRSGGWLVVEGLPDVESWDAIAVAQWSRFAKWMGNGVTYYTSDDAVRETIEANGWLPDLEERERREAWSAEYQPHA